jgi:pyruvate dehydrogenase E1 component
VETELYPTMVDVLAGRSPDGPGGATIAEGIAVTQAGALTSRLIADHTAGVLTVSEDAIEDAIVMLLEIEKTVVEGAGAAGLAAVLKDRERFRGRRVGIVLSGGNIDPRLLASVLPTSTCSTASSGAVLWLAVRMVDHANRERPDGGGIKVGGHQASSASMVSIMTSLWFGHLTGDDKVAVKPHASPVFHAIKYLTGELDRSYLTRLRSLGGLQAYPSRTKDPDVADFSTGSVGLGAVAPLFAAAARRYVDAHFGPRPRPRLHRARRRRRARRGQRLGGHRRPGAAGPRQRDVGRRRQPPEPRPGDARHEGHKLMEFFEDSGWHVVEAKYGGGCRQAFARARRRGLRATSTRCRTSSTSRCSPWRAPSLRERFLDGAPADGRRFLDDVDDDELAPLVQNLGGHDLGELLEAYRACDEVTDRPSVVFAYTVKGWGLPIAGDPLNHAALLSATDRRAARAELGLTTRDGVGPLRPERTRGGPARRSAASSTTKPPPPRPVRPVPDAVGGASPVAPSRCRPRRRSAGCSPSSRRGRRGGPSAWSPRRPT